MSRITSLVGLIVSALLLMLGVGMIMSVLPGKTMIAAGSTHAVGYLASAFAVSYVALQVPVGMLADRWGFKPFLAGGYLLCAGAGLLYWSGTSLSFLFAGRLLQGAGEVPIWALGPALFAALFPDMRGKVVGLYNAAIHLGLTAGPFAGLLLSRAAGEDFLFLAFALLSGLGALLVLVTIRNTDRGQQTAETPKPSLAVLRRIVASRSVAPALAGIALYGAGYGLFITHIPGDLIAVRGFSPEGMGVYFTLFYATISLTQLVSGPLCDRFGTRRFMIGGCLLAAAGIGGFPVLGDAVALCALGASGTGLGIFYLASLAFVNETVPEEIRGGIAGTYFFFWGAGYFLGPLLFGKAVQYGQETGAFETFALLLALAALVLLLSGRSLPDEHVFAGAAETEQAE